MRVPDFSQARILVVGDLMLDRYWHGTTGRISPEAPVPVVAVEQEEARLGGAANVALNLAHLGAQVSVLGYLGEDDQGSVMRHLMAQASIRCLALSCAPAPTITKLRVMSRHQQLIRLDFEASLLEMPEAPLLEAYRQALGEADLVILSDYAKGTLGPVASLLALARQSGIPVLVDPKALDFSRYAGASLLTPNLAELEAVVGNCADLEVLVQKGKSLLAQHELGALLVTRGEKGMTLLLPGEEVMHLPAHARDVYDVTGAGDTVIAVTAAALAAGESLPHAVQLANWAAAIVVAKLGTASVSADELRSALMPAPAPERGIIALDALQRHLPRLRAQGERIVLTNGCFDLLHPGHIQYLEAARQLGDRLLVLVNSDASVSRLKGPSRPVNPLAFRMTMLAALACVDWVLAFDEDTPADMIAAIVPDILVKGGDYKDIRQIAGYDVVTANGGRVEVLSFLDGYSSTRLIDALRQRSE